MLWNNFLYHSYGLSGMKRLTVPQLKSLLQANNLPARGSKPDLIWCLLGSLGATIPEKSPVEVVVFDEDLVYDPWQTVHPHVSEFSVYLLL